MNLKENSGSNYLGDLKNERQQSDQNKDRLLSELEDKEVQRHDGAKIEEQMNENSGNEEKTNERIKSTGGTLLKVGATVVAAAEVVAVTAQTAAAVDAKSFNQPISSSYVENLDGVMPSQAGYDALVDMSGAAPKIENTDAIIENPALYNKLVLKLNTNQIIVNDVAKTMDTIVRVNQDNRTMVPLRFIAENLGQLVDWDGPTGLVFVGFDQLKKADYLAGNYRYGGIGTEIVLKLNTNQLIVNGVAETMDTITRVDENNRTQVPLRFVAEKLGRQVDWDGPTGLVFVNYSPTEKTAYLKEQAEKNIDVEATNIALKYMAGGEFYDYTNCGIYAIYDSKSGAIVVNADGSTSINENTVANMRASLEKNDVLYIKDGKGYVFDSASKTGNVNTCKVACLNTDGSKQDISFNRTRQFPFGNMVFDENKGLCLCDNDNTRLTDVYNPATGQFEEIVTQTEMGTPEQRIKIILNDIYNNTNIVKLDGSKMSVSNSLMLDKNEIDQYIRTGVDSGFKTFTILNDVDGRPKCVLIKGPCGYDDLNVAFMKQSTNFLNQIDHDYLKNSQVDCITNDDFQGENFFKNFGGSGSFWAYDWGNVLQLKPQIPANYDPATQQNIYNESSWGNTMGIIIETRAVRDFLRYELINGKYIIVSQDKFDDEQGLDKTIFADNKLKGYKSSNKVTADQATNMQYPIDADYTLYGKK